MAELWRILRIGGRALVTFPQRRHVFYRRKTSLRVSPEVWAALTGGRPWSVAYQSRTWILRRYLLEKRRAGAVSPSVPLEPSRH